MEILVEFCLHNSFTRVFADISFTVGSRETFPCWRFKERHFRTCHMDFSFGFFLHISFTRSNAILVFTAAFRKTSLGSGSKACSFGTFQLNLMFRFFFSVILRLDLIFAFYSAFIRKWLRDTRSSGSKARSCHAFFCSKRLGSLIFFATALVRRIQLKIACFQTQARFLDSLDRWSFLSIFSLVIRRRTNQAA